MKKININLTKQQMKKIAAGVSLVALVAVAAKGCEVVINNSDNKFEITTEATDYIDTTEIEIETQRETETETEVVIETETETESEVSTEKETEKETETQNKIEKETETQNKIEKETEKETETENNNKQNNNKENNNQNNKPSSNEPTKPENNNPSNNKPGSDDKEDKPVHKHSYGNWVSYNDDLEKGVCACGDVSYRNHNYTLINTTYKTISGTVYKVEEYKCNFDGHIKEVKTVHNHSYGNWVSYNDDLEKSECVCGDVSYRNHNYTLINTTYKTISGTVYKVDEYKCNFDGHIKEVKTVHNHSYGNWVSYSDVQEKGECVCGNVMFRDHAFGPYTDNGDGTETKTCSTCDKTVTKEKPHEHDYGSWTDFTEDKAYKHCVCGDTIEHTHTFDSGSINGGSQVYTCSVCGYQKTVSHQHTYEAGAPTLTNDPNSYCVEVYMTCTDCGDSYLDTSRCISHNWTHFVYNGVDYMSCSNANCNAYKEEIVSTKTNSPIIYATDCDITNLLAVCLNDEFIEEKRKSLKV